MELGKKYGDPAKLFTDVSSCKKFTGGLWALAKLTNARSSEFYAPQVKRISWQRQELEVLSTDIKLAWKLLVAVDWACCNDFLKSIGVWIHPGLRMNSEIVRDDNFFLCKLQLLYAQRDITFYICYIIII